MTNGYNLKNQYAIYFVTFTVVGWVDVFTRKETKYTKINALSCDLK
jgi:putative transposase